MNKPFIDARSSYEQYRCADCGTLFYGVKDMNFELCSKCSEGEGKMNNQKQQALDDIKKQILDLVNGPDSPFKIAAIRCLIEQLPDTLNTSCRCDYQFKIALKLAQDRAIMFKKERDAAYDKNEKDFQRFEKNLSELQSQLEAERAAHAETQAQLELAQQAETRALQGWHEEQRESDELPTKAERLGELERDKAVIEKHFGEDMFVSSIEILDIEDKPMRIVIRKVSHSIYLREFEYKPEPMSPADGEPVFAYDGTRWFSTGEIDTGGRLIVKAGHQSTCLENWCSISDRSKHSPGWKPKWEPDYDKK